MSDEDWEKCAWDEITQIENEQHNKDKKFLDKVKEMVTSKFYKLIEDEIEESEGGRNFRIVDNYLGDKQNNTGINLWVDQRAVGDSGDSWEGTICVELSNNKYLMWDYWM